MSLYSSCEEDIFLFFLLHLFDLNFFAAFSQLWRTQGCVDIQKLENEYVIVSAQYLLTQANVKATSTGK